MIEQAIAGNGGSKGMPKPFSEIRIEPNDDGTFQVNLRPWIDPKSLDKGQSKYDAEESGTRKFTVNSLSEIDQKIEKYAKGKNVVEDFMNGPSVDEESSDQEDEE